LPVMAMMLSAMPRLFRNDAVAGHTLQRWLLVVAGLYGCLAAAITVLLSPWVEQLLGSVYAGVSELICLLAFSVPALCVRAAATNVLTTLQRPWLRIGLELTGWLVIVVLAQILAQSRGSLGLAIAVICAEW